MRLRDTDRDTGDVDRAGVTERPRVSLGQKVVAGGVGVLAILILMASVAWRIYNKSAEPPANTPPVNAAAGTNSPGELDVSLDIDKKCPPGIDCTGTAKPIGVTAAAPTESEEEMAARLRRLQQEELLREIVLQRRMSSELTDKKATSSLTGQLDSDVSSTPTLASGLQRVNYVAPRATSGSALPNANISNDASNAKAAAVGSTTTVNELERQLAPTNTPAMTAGMLPNRSLMVAKGQSATCVLDVAMSSEQPGFVRCILDFPIMSADGKVVMMERGTAIDGEYRKGIDRGVRSAFVLWTRATTPEGVFINLDSPATDNMGRTGIPGEVDSRFWDRYKGAILFSVLQDVTQIGTGILSAFGVSGPYGIPLPQNTGTATTSVAGEIMKRDADVKDVLITNQGKIVGITIARDLDFSTVYSLKLKSKI